MSEHPKLPDIVEALEWLNYRIAIDDPAWRHLRALKAEIKRLRSPAPAEEAWTGACGYCPANFRMQWELDEHRRSHMEPAGTVPVSEGGGPAEDGERLREALVRIEIITASGRTDELLGKMKTINSLAHSALSNSISQGEK